MFGVVLVVGFFLRVVLLFLLSFLEDFLGRIYKVSLVLLFLRIVNCSLLGFMNVVFRFILI